MKLREWDEGGEPPCNPSLGWSLDPSQVPRENARRAIKYHEGPIKHNGPRGHDPDLSRQENNWGRSDTLGDHNATRDAHNGKSQWKSVERSQFSPRRLNPILSTSDLEHLLNSRLNEVKMNKNRCSGSKTRWNCPDHWVPL